MRRLLFISSVCVALVSACKNTEAGSVDESALRSADAEKPDGACDAEKLKALMQALATATPGGRSELVADRLGDVCELPPPVKSFFAATAEESEDTNGAAEQERAQKAVADARAALEVICPDAKQVRTAQAAVAADERQALLFDSCDFQRFKLVDKETWLRGDPSSPVPFFAFDWLVQQGISEGEAKVLAGLMVVRDRKRWGLSDQTLAKVEQGLAPIPAGTVVHISPTHISFQGQKLVSIKDGQLDPGAVKGHLIGPLFDQLAAAADKYKQLAEVASREWSGTLVVVADASTPQHVLIRVLFSAGQAEFSRYALVAQSAPYSYGAVLVDPPKFSAGPQPHKPAEFLVGVSAEGFRVRSSTSTKGATLIPGLEGGTWDFGGLTAAAEEHKAAHPKATVARVRGEDSTTFGTFTQALAAVSGPRCHTAEGACLLPGLVIEAGGGTVEPEAAARAAGILEMMGPDSAGSVESRFKITGFDVGDADVAAGALGEPIGVFGEDGSKGKDGSEDGSGVGGVGRIDDGSR